MRATSGLTRPSFSLQQLGSLVKMNMQWRCGNPVDHVDDLKQSSLFYAVPEGHVDTIKFLMRKGAEPSLRDENGETAIFYAVLEKWVDDVQALLDGGAHLFVVNHWGNICARIAGYEMAIVTLRSTLTTWTKALVGCRLKSHSKEIGWWVQTSSK
eukprot:Skav209188  [mRNA]  locus=scaffold1137:678966:679430:+ [translate_table: standard]